MIQSGISLLRIYCSGCCPLATTSEGSLGTNLQFAHDFALPKPALPPRRIRAVVHCTRCTQLAQERRRLQSCPTNPYMISSSCPSYIARRHTASVHCNVPIHYTVQSRQFTACVPFSQLSHFCLQFVPCVPNSFPRVLHTNLPITNYQSNQFISPSTTCPFFRLNLKFDLAFRRPSLRQVVYCRRLDELGRSGVRIG